LLSKSVLASQYLPSFPHDALPISIQEGIVLSKRVQATFDYLFGITIGAFIVVATTAGITSRKDFFHYMTNEFPNSYVFYVFIMVDRKSTRLNSSHDQISYAVFCLK